ncbi:MAG: hypothetical protein V4722_04470 [Bacteroidota bacterium]
MRQPLTQGGDSTLKKTCYWCQKPMSRRSVRCSVCSKLRKDIDDDKKKCYLSLTIGVAAVVIGLALFVSGKNGVLSSDSIKLILIIAGVGGLITGFFFYLKASEKMDSYFWH